MQDSLSQLFSACEQQSLLSLSLKTKLVELCCWSKGLAWRYASSTPSKMTTKAKTATVKVRPPPFSGQVGKKSDEDRNLTNHHLILDVGAASGGKLLELLGFLRSRTIQFFHHIGKVKAFFERPCWELTSEFRYALPGVLPEFENHPQIIAYQ